MRKFFGVLLYLFAGMFIGTLVVVVGGNYNFTGEKELVVGIIIAVIGILFLLLAAWVHPSKAWKKHMAITIAVSTVIMFLGNVNQYFVIKGIQDNHIETEYTKILQDVPLTFNWTASIVMVIVLLGISLLLYKNNS